MSNQNTETPAVGSSTIVRSVQSRNVRCLPMDTARCYVLHKMHRPSFRAWLHALEAYPHLLLETERTLRDVGRCQTTLCRWREFGYPDPGDWPVDSARFAECSSWDVLVFLDDAQTGAVRPNATTQPQPEAVGCSGGLETPEECTRITQRDLGNGRTLRTLQVNRKHVRLTLEENIENSEMLQEAREFPHKTALSGLLEQIQAALKR